MECLLGLGVNDVLGLGRARRLRNEDGLQKCVKSTKSRRSVLG